MMRMHQVATSEQTASIAFVRKWAEYLDTNGKLECGGSGGVAELGQCYTWDNLYVDASGAFK